MMACSEKVPCDVRLNHAGCALPGLCLEDGKALISLEEKVDNSAADGDFQVRIETRSWSPGSGTWSRYGGLFL